MQPPILRLVTPRRVAALRARYGLERLLAPPELAAYRGLALAARRRDWLAGRLAAKAALRRALPPGERLAPGRVRIANAPDGVPGFLLDRPGPPACRRWSLSIAHADGFGLAGVTAVNELGWVGVDLEPERALPPRVVSFFASPRELGGVRGAASEGWGPVGLWTVKEAAFKAATAAGAPAALSRVEVRPGSRRLSARVGGLTLRVRWRRFGRFHVAWAWSGPRAD